MFAVETPTVYPVFILSIFKIGLQFRLKNLLACGVLTQLFLINLWTDLELV